MKEIKRGEHNAVLPDDGMVSVYGLLDELDLADSNTPNRLLYL